MPLKIELNDVLTLKKPHPCGSYNWEVLRTGADFRLKCIGCGHLIMIPRSKMEKRVRKINGEKLK